MLGVQIGKARIGTIEIKIDFAGRAVALFGDDQFRVVLHFIGEGLPAVMAFGEFVGLFILALDRLLTLKIIGLADRKSVV